MPNDATTGPAYELIGDQHAMVEEFNLQIIGMPLPPAPTLLTDERAEFRIGHLDEELAEARKAQAEGDMAEFADAMVDIAYVALGALVEMGIVGRAAFEEVHRANMAKRQGTKSNRPNSKGYDAIKPEGWRGPDYRDLLVTRLEDVRRVVAARRTFGEEAVLDYMAIGYDDDRGLGAVLEQRSSGGVTETVYDPRKSDGGGFMKFDADKESRPELIPAFVIYDLGRLYAKGARKYAAENWRKGSSYQRYIGAHDRHVLAYRKGEDIDVGTPEVPGTMEHHLLCGAWNLLTLYAQIQLGIGEDDLPDRRRKGLSTAEKIQERLAQLGEKKDYA